MNPYKLSIALLLYVHSTMSFPFNELTSLYLHNISLPERLKDCFDYDCALLDKNMPGTDGIETIRSIRKMESQTGNFTELEKSSHKLAGSICCFYVETLFKAARDIEQHARNRNLCEARKAFAEIAASMESFVSELTILKKELEECKP
jgi:CheY-like chemotaxis protein